MRKIILLILCFISSMTFADNKCKKLYDSKQYASAFNTCKDSAELTGDSVAQVVVGYMYYYGYGVKKDYSKAIYWYRQAAKQGNDEAQANLGVLLYNGEPDGIEELKDAPQGTYWIQKSANQGDKFAYSWLDLINEFCGTDDIYSLNAEYWYKKAADIGNDCAQAKLSYMYYYGYGVKQDYYKANYWYQRSSTFLQKRKEARESADLINRIWSTS